MKFYQSERPSPISHKFLTNKFISAECTGDYDGSKTPCTPSTTAERDAGTVGGQLGVPTTNEGTVPAPEDVELPATLATKAASFD